MKKLLSIFIFLLLNVFAFAQDTSVSERSNDSVKKHQNIQPVKDSVSLDSTAGIIKKDSGIAVINKTNFSDSLRADSLKKDSVKAAQLLAQKNDSIKKSHVIQLMPGIPKQQDYTDVVFYVLIFLLFLLGLIKTSFPKYFHSIFRLSFQATFRQKQTREQMAQNVLPAFMLNVLFVFCAGLFITLYANAKELSALPFWQLFIYSTVILLGVYLVKYLVIRFTGWVFNAQEAAGEYRFVVFLINKLLGVLLIPLLFLIAYANSNTKAVCITIVICLAVFSLAVRYLVSLARIRKNLSITAFHFFIYLCAVEIMPLLVIYKVLFLQTGNR